MLKAMRHLGSWSFWRIAWPCLRPVVTYTFLSALIMKTQGFQSLRWLGHPIRQPLLDLWTLQETIADLRPTLILETGTCDGGSALFYAQLMDLLRIDGQVITIDIARIAVGHPRVQAWQGDSTSAAIVDRARQAVHAANGPILVILDSDHSAAHVARELDAYAPFVSRGSLLLVQDGVVDTLGVYRADRPGPLPAIHQFLARHPEFQIDRELAERFLVTHHPDGWLRRL
jgi:cephalosporin hydroxylase